MFNFRQYARHELLSDALRYTNEPITRQSGPKAGHPRHEKELSKIITRFIRDMKSQGRMIEKRPFINGLSNKRHARFIFVPHTIDMFHRIPGAQAAEPSYGDPLDSINTRQRTPSTQSHQARIQTP